MRFVFSPKGNYQVDQFGAQLAQSRWISNCRQLDCTFPIIVLHCTAVLHSDDDDDDDDDDDVDVDDDGNH